MLSIVIPCYKEAKTIEHNVGILKKYLKSNNIDAEILCVNDGSPDDTFKVLKSIEGIKAIGYKDNRGKGGAVSYGLSHAKGEYIIYMDADLSTHLDAILESLRLLDDGYDFVVASRYDKTSKILVKQPFKRRVISKLSRIIIKMMFHFKLKETQCGFKAMTKETAALILSKTKIPGFSFDVEYLYILKLNKKKYVSLPITWKDDRTSTVTPLKTSFKFFKDLFVIKRYKKDYLPK